MTFIFLLFTIFKKKDFFKLKWYIISWMGLIKMVYDFFLWKLFRLIIYMSHKYYLLSYYVLKVTGFM